MSDLFFDPILEPILRLTVVPEPPSGSGEANPWLQGCAPRSAPDDGPWPADRRSLEILASAQQAAIRRLRQRVQEAERELGILRDYVRSIRAEAVPDPFA